MIGLRALAEQHLGLIQEDRTLGFGYPIKITDPDGNVFPTGENLLTGFSNDISMIIDPDTGQAISGRLATVSIRIKHLTDNGISILPEGVSDNSKKPWLVEFDDINGNPFTFKVQQTDPDRAIGNLIMILEHWKT